MSPFACCRLAGAALALAAATFGFSAAAQAPGLGAGAELVDPDALRVCADPRNLPFSDEKGDGFENKIARLLGEKLGKPVTYTYFPQIIGFVRNTLNAYRCDIVMGVAVGDDLVQTTTPYYHTSYALLVKKGSDLDGVAALDDPRLKDKRIGVVAGTPPATVMARNGLLDRAKPYPLTVDTRAEAPAKSMVDDLQAGQIDAGVLWGPIAGYWAVHQQLPLTLTPLASGGGVRMDFLIAMGVRRSDQAWKRELNTLISVLPQVPRPAGLPSGTVWRAKPRLDIPGSLWLPDTGYGELAPIMQDYFERGLQRATSGDRDRLLVIYCRDTCWHSWNAAKRALALGYTHVAWYREGTDSWAEAGHPLELREAEPRPEATLPTVASHPVH